MFTCLVFLSFDYVEFLLSIGWVEELCPSRSMVSGMVNRVFKNDC